MPVTAAEAAKLICDYDPDAEDEKYFDSNRDGVVDDNEFNSFLGKYFPEEDNSTNDN